MLTINKQFIPSVLLLLVVFVAAARPAEAQFTFSFASGTMSVSPGSTVTFSGTMTNSGTSTIYFNADSLQGLDSSISTDDSAFVFDAPLLLAGGDSYTGDMFSITPASTTPGSTYDGTFFILGGTDSNALDYLSTTFFHVTVLAPIPEASSVISLGLLMVLGLGGLALGAYRRKVRSAK